MGSRFLLSLADWCRQAGLVTIEDVGWQYRARSSGGYDDGLPICVMLHHTASVAHPQNDVNFICRSSVAPISNLYLARDGRVWVCAGGATNTNGKGGPVTVSRGTIARDTMNRCAVSIEAANNGIGEPWPQVQIDAYFKLSNKLTAELGLRPSDLLHHHTWAPGRKVDCARADAVQGPWRPSSINSSGSWSLLDTQHEATFRAAPTTPPPLPPPDTRPPLPPVTEDMMRLTVAKDASGAFWIGDGLNRRWIDDLDLFSNYVALAVGDAKSYQLVNTLGREVRNANDVLQVGDVTINALGALLVG